MIRSLKRFLVGAAFTSMALPSMAMAGSTCVYVLGHTPGGTVTTPAVPIVVPASEAQTEPVRVHLDETAQNILGYSLTIPGADVGTEGTPLFSIPEVNETIPGFSVNVPEVDLTRYRCVDASGATVPAIPYYVPASAFVLPGGFVDVGAIYFNLTGQTLTVPGKLLTFDGRQIIFPEQSGSTPATSVTTPDLSVTFYLNDAPATVRYLQPH